MAEDLRTLPGVEHVEIDAPSRSVTAFPRDDELILTSIGDLAGAKGWPLEQLQLESGRLDEVFRTITTQEAA